MDDSVSSLEISPISITTEMERSYLDYAMSVIVSRALPDARDGLKPVQRRILFAMKEGGYEQGKPLRKSARIVGDVMSKYHPHGDTAIYDAMVRLAQPFALRLLLVEGQGNFGSMDGDPAAAMRYTEARLGKAASALLSDIDADTVDFRPNYDNTLNEPKVLPASYPNLLVNGGAGIAVGMATNIPPHNLGEIIDGCCLLIDQPDVDDAALRKVIPGPDFPTGGIILGREGIASAYQTGRGSIKIRSKIEVESTKGDRSLIVVHEIPYQVNKSRLMERIAEVAREGLVEDIADLRDESDRRGTRIVIQTKRSAQSEVVINQLYRHTPLQVSFGINMLALTGDMPKTLNLRQILTLFLQFREETLRRRCAFHLRKAREKAHLLIGLAVAVANIDTIIALIRKAKNSSDARAQLIAQPWPCTNLAPLLKAAGDESVRVDDYQLSTEQAKAILDLRLHRLTGLERDAIRSDLEETAATIVHYTNLLTQRALLIALMREELVNVKEAFADPRRTEISDLSDDIDDEELIQEEDIVVTLSHAGYVKRVPRHVYSAQRHGGKGRTGMKPRDEDWLTHVCDVSTHTSLLFFSSRGIVYRIKAYRLPIGTPQARGKPLVNFLPLQEGEKITALMPMPEGEEELYQRSVIFATASGYVRRNLLSDFTRIASNGKIAIKLPTTDQLVAVMACTKDDDVLLATKAGQSIRFSVEDLRVFRSRNSLGVRGIKLAPEDHVISMTILPHTPFSVEERDSWLRRSHRKKLKPEVRKALEKSEKILLTLTSQGMGKRTSSHAYRITRRGGKGVVNIALDSKTLKKGGVVTTFPVENDSEILIVTDGGKIIRCPVKNIRTIGRATKGVRVFQLDSGSQAVSATVLSAEKDDAPGKDAPEKDAPEKNASKRGNAQKKDN